MAQQSGGLSPELLLLLAGGLQGVGGMMNSRQQAAQNDRDRFLGERGRQEGREDSRRAAISAFLQSIFSQDEQDRLSRAGLGLSSTQMNPHVPAQSRARSDIARQLGQNFQPFRISSDLSGSSGGLRPPAGGFDMSALSPENLDESERLFYTQVANANPFAPTGGGPGVEAFRQQALQDRASRRSNTEETVLNYLNQIGNPTQRQIDIGQDYDDGDSGGTPWWKKALGIASFALPFVGPAVGLSGLATTLGSAAAGGAAGGLGGAISGGIGAVGAGQTGLPEALQRYLRGGGTEQVPLYRPPTGQVPTLPLRGRGSVNI